MAETSKVGGLGVEQLLALLDGFGDAVWERSWHGSVLMPQAKRADGRSLVACGLPYSDFIWIWSLHPRQPKNYADGR